MKNMNKLKFKKEPTKFRDTFLFVLIFALCAATIVTIQLKSKNSSDTADTVNSDQTYDETDTAQAETDDLPIDEIGHLPDNTETPIKTQSEANIINNNEAADDDKTSDAKPESKQTTNQKLDFAPPCNGKIIKKFSDSDLVYSKTMDDWRIHLGVDLSVPIGTEIGACESGIIEEVINDLEYGNTVVIKHNGVYTKYSNLAGANLPVKGNSVDKGDVIGVVSDSAVSEILDESHLHFSICENDIYIDPSKYINFQN